MINRKAMMRGTGKSYQTCETCGARAQKMGLHIAKSHPELYDGMRIDNMTEEMRRLIQKYRDRKQAEGVDKHECSN